jgi:hypothetical protein
MVEQLALNNIHSSFFTASYASIYDMHEEELLWPRAKWPPSGVNMVRKLELPDGSFRHRIS